MQISKILEKSTGQPSDQIQAVLQAVRRHLSMDVGFVSEFVGDSRVFRFSDSEDSSNPVIAGSSDPLEKSFCHYVALGTMPQLMADARTDPIASTLSVTHELPVGAHLSVPLRHADGTVFGTLCCFSFRPDYHITNRDLDVLRICADVVSALAEKDRNASFGRSVRRERIKRVIDEKAIETDFQPIYRVAGERLIAFEALSRFPVAPLRAPDIWFAEANEVDLGEELEFLAVRKALSHVPLFDKSVSISINLSPSAIIKSDIESIFFDAPLERVIIELTEHAVVSSYDSLRAALKPLRSRGLRLAIDDVGSGHSTLRHVLDLSPELVKLDRSLIHNLDKDLGRRALAEALITYGRKIGCEVVAEGVETQSEYLVLKEIGVTSAQGYFVGRPLTCENAAKLSFGRI